ncbi:class C beta-lactamase [Massilia sp. CF038]|uniref:class C beta-lactamase n=1 Tax=Massilia sp. CF038 TaxID=1881045 RepID=UPI00091DD2F4|nr:class C beta-lactamase [Massilia sp. CF038]SHH20105.1 Beta-lactamase class D [Massilia sp. CF038]
MTFRMTAMAVVGAVAALVAAPALHAAEICTAIADAATGKVLMQRGDCQRQVTPASTFKIPLSLMGYDAGFLKDTQTPELPFRQGYVDWRPSWRSATAPAKWMSESVVWYSQQITQSLGKKRFAEYTTRFNYGNADVSGDAGHEGLTAAWLESSLRISPLEQLSFLGKVVNRQLGVSEHAYAMTAQLTQWGQSPDGWRIHGKTGSGDGYGWYVGWASKGARAYVFARLIQKDKSDAADVPGGMLARDSLMEEFPALVNGIAVDQTMRPLMQENDIPGMAVAVSVNGKHYFYHYGVASKETGQPVTNATLFEIGSLSKTFTATLATYAQAQGKLAMTDAVSQHVPQLRGSNFDHIQLLHLGTHTVGDFPMQVPLDIKTYDQLMDYYKRWQPGHGAGTHRTYSNLGIGLLSIATAHSLGMPYVDAVEQTLLPALGLKHTWIKVPADEMAQYAQGYNSKGAPVRVNPGVLADEAYGVKSTAADLIHFLDANMGLITLDANLARAIRDTHAGYFKAGPMTQDLVWEQYPSQAALEQLLVSTSEKMTRESNPVSTIAPPLPPQAHAWLHKTGSTGGFSAYALFNPARKVGIVILANRVLPGDQRVRAAYGLLNQLGPDAP